MKNPYINSSFFSILESQSINLKTNLKGFFGGKHKTNTYGQTVEFADYREYILGDDIRKIDWNLYSRLEKHYIKLFRDEKQMQVNFFIDCSSSMGPNDSKKAHYTLALAAGLGFLAVHDMDKVSYKLINQNKINNISSNIVGKKSFYEKISLFDNIEFNGDSHISEAILNNSNDKLSGLVVMISDFLTDNDWKKSVEFLIHKGCQILLLQVLTPEEISPLHLGRTNLIDSEADSSFDPKNIRVNITSSLQDSYDETFNEIQNDIKNFSSKMGIDYISIDTSKSIDKVIFSELLKIELI